MTDVIETPDELTTLKARADKMGIAYHPSIGVDKLRAKLEEVLAGKPPANDDDADPVEAPVVAPVTTAALRLRKKQEASELVRIQVTCMNPNKSEWQGEMFTTGNSVVGTYRRYVPFNVEWHVERIILNMMKQRQCQIFVNQKDSKGRSVRKGKLIREFNIAELEALSKDELKELAQRQAMANGTQAAA